MPLHYTAFVIIKVVKNMVVTSSESMALTPFTCRVPQSCRGGCIARRNRLVTTFITLVVTRRVITLLGPKGPKFVVFYLGVMFRIRLARLQGLDIYTLGF